MFESSHVEGGVKRKRLSEGQDPIRFTWILINYVSLSFDRSLLLYIIKNKNFIVSLSLREKDVLRRLQKQNKQTSKQKQK